MKKLARFISAVITMTFFICSIAQGADNITVMNGYTEADSVVLFVKDPGQEIDKIYLDNEEAKSFVIEEKGPVRNVVLLDNSLSINKKYRDGIKAFLTELAAARNPGDTFTIATFAKDVTYLVQNSDDYLEIKNQIDALEFVDQESYFTNTVYTILDTIDEYEEIMYTRVIIIADGVDNEALGYTDDELSGKILAAKVPVYTLGCSSSGNGENLKKMFALSRLSGGKSYLLDDVSGADILNDISACEKLIKIHIFPKDESCDGSPKIVRVYFGEKFCSTELAMPFKAAEEPTIELAAEETEAETQPVLEIEPVEEEAEKEIPVVLISICVILLLVIGIAVVMLKKKEKPEIEDRIDLSRIGHSADTVLAQREMAAGTEILGADPYAHVSGKTDIIVSRSSVTVILQDLSNPSKTFEYPLRDRVFVGRDAGKCQIVIDYDRYITSVHCEIIPKDNGIYVRDGGLDVTASTNGTFVNGQKAAPELPLPSGATLKLGQLRFKVTYR